MSRSLIKVRNLLALTALSGAVGLGACSKSSEPSNNSDLGGLKVALAVQGGYTVNTVSYTVNASPGGAVVKSGSVDVSGAGASVSFALELPPGTDTITLTATSTTGVTFTGTSPAFTVVSGQTVGVSVTLTNTVADAGPAAGQIDVNGTIVPGDNRPQITFVIVSPLQIAVGGTVSVSVSATDADAADVLSYAWTATPDGAFASATSTTTTYSSGTVGTKNLTITVNDNHSPAALTASVSVAVNVISVTGTGGTTGAAGAPATGGTTGTGGTPATGGTTGAAGAPATGGTTGAAGAPATGGTTGAAGASGPSALETDEENTLIFPDELIATTYTHAADPGSGSTIPVGWGPSTLPTAAQQTAAAALIRAIAADLPDSVRNSPDTAAATPGTPVNEGDANPPNGLLVLGSDPSVLFGAAASVLNKNNTALTAAQQAAALTLWNAWKAAAVSDSSHAKTTFDPGGPTATDDGSIGTYISSNSTNFGSAVGIASNIVQFAVQYGLIADLKAF